MGDFLQKAFNILGPGASYRCKRLNRHMKKTVITILLLTTTLLAAWAGKPEKLERLARQYKGEEGFEMVSIGKLGIRLFHGVASAAGDLDAEEREALKVFKGLNRLIIIDFDDISQARKAAFTAKVEKILEGMDLILEAKDEDEAIRIYGVDDGQFIRDCILYSSDGTLIVTKGRFNLDSIGKLTQMAK